LGEGQSGKFREAGASLVGSRFVARGGVAMVSTRGNLTLQEKLGLLNCRRLPGRLNTSETALLLGVHEHDVPVLVAARLLLPLGKPAPNAPKYFASVEVAANAENAQWLAEATKALAKHWFRKNRRNRAVKRYANVS
jgi:hypothetical protein